MNCCEHCGLTYETIEIMWFLEHKVASYDHLPILHINSKCIQSHLKILSEYVDERNQRAISEHIHSDA